MWGLGIFNIEVEDKYRDYDSLKWKDIHGWSKDMGLVEAKDILPDMDLALTQSTQLFCQRQREMFNMIHFYLFSCLHFGRWIQNSTTYY